MKIHSSGEDYLETILILHKKVGMVRSVDVARHSSNVGLTQENNSLSMGWR